MLTGDLKWGALHAAEAFILPSHQENFGIAVVEALACGKPVLISDKVNIWREIEADGACLVARRPGAWGHWNSSRDGSRFPPMNARPWDSGRGRLLRKRFQIDRATASAGRPVA